jgi:predicted nucleic acid-binding protein
MGGERVSGDEAMLFIGDVRERLTVVSLNEQEYFKALEESAAIGIVGGAIYDALLAHSALKAKARTIYTWNMKDFVRLGPEIAGRVRTPAE